MSGKDIGYRRKKVMLTKKLHYTLEGRAKLSEQRKGEKNPMFGKHTKAWNKGLSAKNDRRLALRGAKLHELRVRTNWHPWNKGLTKASDIRILHCAELRMHRKYPTKDTCIEKILQQALLQESIVGWVTHYAIEGQPDIAFVEQKIAIFADGDYWHNRPERIVRDSFVNNYLKSQGWQVLRFWGSDILQNIDKVLIQIKEAKHKLEIEQHAN